MDKRIAQLIQLMSQYDRGDIPRINHFLKVHNLAAVIGMMENIDKDQQLILEAAAILHDIGIHVSEQKYGRCDGYLQEREGPAEARRILDACGGFNQEQVERICYLIAHHHTYTDIQGIDYQILVEADSWSISMKTSYLRRPLKTYAEKFSKHSQANGCWKICIWLSIKSRFRMPYKKKYKHYLHEKRLQFF